MPPRRCKHEGGRQCRAGEPIDCHDRDCDFRIVVSVLTPDFSTAVRLQGSGAERRQSSVAANAVHALWFDVR
jgi:hypothetical protein